MSVLEIGIAIMFAIVKRCYRSLGHWLYYGKDDIVCTSKGKRQEHKLIQYAEREAASHHHVAKRAKGAQLFEGFESIDNRFSTVYQSKSSHHCILCGCYRYPLYFLVTVPLWDQLCISLTWTTAPGTRS